MGTAEPRDGMFGLKKGSERWNCFGSTSELGKAKGAFATMEKGRTKPSGRTQNTAEWLEI